MGSTERWPHVRAILEAALDLQPDARAAYLDRECAEDPELRQEVDQLIAAEADATGVLPGDDELPAWLGARIGSALVGTRIGSCRVLGVLGVGGMGTVYEAEQDHPRRIVAVKVLRVSDRVPVERFHHEAELLASLRHPNVAQVYEAGVHELRLGEETIRAPFIVMEPVEGARTLIDYAVSEGLSLEQRLRLFIGVCEAVEHAHQKSLVHRDLKPDNLLVDKHGRVKVIDFGIARVVAQNDAIEGADTAGTERYMSPEQRRGEPRDLDTRADVYALGIVLAELVPDGNREVDWIVSLASAEDREQRYRHAGELADDIRRFLHHEPLRAAPGGGDLFYRLRKAVRRHRLRAAALVVFATGLLVGVAGLAVGLVEAKRQREVAEAKASEAEAVVDFLQSMLIEAQPWHGGDEVTVRQVLESTAERIDTEFGDRPGVAAALHATVGWSLRGLGLPQQAAPHLERAVALMEQTATTREREGIVARYRLATVLGDLGETRAAEPMLATLAHEAEATLGPDDDLTLAALDLWAVALSALGRPAEAAPVMSRVLELSERRYGTQNKVTIAHRNNLVSVLTASGRQEEAAEQATIAAESMRQLFGEGDPHTQVTIQNQAALLTLLGRHEESEALSREVLALRQPMLGDEHPYTILSHYWLGLALLGQERFEEAREVFEPAFEHAGRVLGESHSHRRNLALGLARALAGCGELARARELAREVLEATEGDDQPAVIGVHRQAEALLSKWDGAEDR